MAFFKSFQESLSSVSVSSILDSVSSTVSNTVDGVKTAVNDVTYTVSDQLTEQVSTIINKKQSEDEDKGKREEGEGSSEKDSDRNSKRHAYADEEEERREREKQEQERKNEEEQWEWCYTSSKGWYRKRRDPNQKDTSSERQAERPENKEEGTAVSGQLSSSNGDMNLQEVAAERMENNEGGQEDTISKTSAETVYCEDTGTEQSPNFNNDQTNRHARDGHARDGHPQNGHAQNTGETQPDERRNSTSNKPKQNTGGGADGGGAVESIGVERQLPEDGDSEEGSSRSRGSSVLKDQRDEDEVMGSQGHSDVDEVSGDGKDTERSFNKNRVRRCTLL
ncbi:cilia- and flagella-associated protein 251-like [Neoarius graeffei]|uniref:cilia- and flagella-associated protein 251-like n=1 Tax=Neoarius graeffei TaxID=443677 RepID=UPI00298D5825|nr:cilia- and flagella-associated protein 251-like [Neoarius graeffei]XP_060772177.1 cilia- and flagella-associated protein 251-like [Neoarius graeffei]XP_060772178.1 cilia- and flagella-associated protein 251-like [Neoarius graeffei]XP_060772179.1 cilia- and flagella-associated protein 251-like [Neoarius graeffei]XP_060772181.1 cilia- and flagella-associated protein 251-like [Neoarius graeffei]XP_060772182.1 cilia- and flagella-associated protein 251-like [Neoarius graeffei]XP_060772183.1 ci